MPFFGLRFDFRNPSFASVSMTERFNAGLEMTRWADERGFVVVVLSEHHGSDDGYLPSPLVMASAMAAVTRNIRVMVSAIVAPLHDPLRLAEDAAVVDLISGGRLDLVLANGYVAAEFDMFGVALGARAQRTKTAVGVLRKAWTGQPFIHEGREVRVSPAPDRVGGPAVSLGGSTEVAARRAARIADGFVPSVPEVWAYYRDERISLGHADPGEYHGAGIANFYLCDDVEQGWRDVGQYFEHETNAYGRWMVDAGLAGMYEQVADVDDVRSRGMYRVLTPDLLLAEIAEQGPFAFVLMHPLLGGIPPSLGWRALRLFEQDVLTRLPAV